MKDCDFCGTESGIKEIEINGVQLIIGQKCLRWRTGIKNDEI